MDKLIISGDGFPGTNELLEFLQESAHKPIEALAEAFGDNSIVKGLEFQGNGSLSSGWIVYDSDIIPFQASSASVGENPTIEVYEQIISAGYDSNGDGQFINNQPIWKFVKARVGDGNGEGVIASFPFSSLERLPSNRDLKNANSILKKGVIGFNFNDQTLNTSGDFTGGESLTNFTDQNHQFFRIDFEELEDDKYTVIVVCNDNNLTFVQTVHSIFNKTTTSFNVNFRLLSNFGIDDVPFEVIILR